jgi:hypothetical protein
MGSPAENVAKLKDAYRQWHESKGGSVKLWLDLMADYVRLRSLAAGAPEARFTGEVNSKADFERYFKGLLDDWEMIDYTTTVFIAEGNHVAMRARRRGATGGPAGWSTRPRPISGRSRTARSWSSTSCTTPPPCSPPPSAEPQAAENGPSASLPRRSSLRRRRPTPQPSLLGASHRAGFEPPA